MIRNSVRIIRSVTGADLRIPRGGVRVLEKACKSVGIIILTTSGGGVNPLNNNLNSVHLSPVIMSHHIQYCVILKKVSL